MYDKADDTAKKDQKKSEEKTPNTCYYVGSNNRNGGVEQTEYHFTKGVGDNWLDAECSGISKVPMAAPSSFTGEAELTPEQKLKYLVLQDYNLPGLKPVGEIIDTMFNKFSEFLGKR